MLTRDSPSRSASNRYKKKRPTSKDFPRNGADYITMISSDGIEFHIRRELAYASRTIRSMMDSPTSPSDAEKNVVHFRSIPSHILQKVCHYFLYRNRYENSEIMIPEFKIEPQLSLQLLMAANFLDC
ncbi:unnamed protein product [Cylicocyclus nassatus]|uniref:Elongin-C n=1 Tax=Cylicocyclus nassatus TaxID=53992 RepID=A0AA36H5D9_CYLNA|nr:unnamed protein product [Cylicocyclus nassatus]